MQKPLTILQVVSALYGDPLSRDVLDYSRAMINKGYRSLVASHDGPAVPQLVAEGGKHYSLPIHRPGLWTWWQMFPLRRLIQTEKPDLIHVHERFSWWLVHCALLGLPAASRPAVVSTVHQRCPPGLYSTGLLRSERVIVHSHALWEFLQQRDIPGLAERLLWLPRGIEADEFPHGYQPPATWWHRLYREFPELELKQWITLPGKLDHDHGHGNFLAILQRLKTDRRLENHPWHAVILGGADPLDQQYLYQLQSEVEQRQLHDCVTFVGRRQDRRDWLAASQLVLALPDNPDSVSRAILEALQLGVPVVGWKRGLAGEWLEDFYPAGAIAPDDFESLYEHVVPLLCERQRIPAGPQHSLKAMTEGVLACYESLR